MIGIVAAAFLAAQASADRQLLEAEHALAANRVEQARIHARRVTSPSARLNRLLGDIAVADKNWAEAYARFREASRLEPDDLRTTTRAGISAMKVGDLVAARALLDRATANPAASWEAWNAAGVLADMESDWTRADQAYANATRLAPSQAQVANNQGWSLILRGDWKAAVVLLERAAAANPGSLKIRNNLDLATAALTEGLPSRAKGESNADYAARLNDAGVAAEMREEHARASAAFSRALMVNDIWYARAAQNLSGAGSK